MGIQVTFLKISAFYIFFPGWHDFSANAPGLKIETKTIFLSFMNAIIYMSIKPYIDHNYTFFTNDVPQ